METSSNLKSFLKPRPSKIIVTSQGCDRLLKIESAGHDMDHLVQDFQTALDETALSNISNSTTRTKSWKRKCKSTSNLVHASDDSSSSVDYVGLQSRDKGTSSLQLSDSDIEIEPGSHAMGTELVRTGRNRQDRMQEYRSRRGGADYLGMESDSYTENISPVKKYGRVNARRKRKIKRMAVEPCTVPIDLRNSGGKSIKENLCRWSGADVRRTTRKKAVHVFLRGKRKRSAIGKSVESEEISVSSSRGASQDDEDKMEMEELDSSSSLSSSEWEWVHNDSDEGPEEEADDEHSDWPGPEPGMSAMHLTDEEIDSEISSPRLLDGPALEFSGRVLRSGNRRLKGQSVKYKGERAEFAMPGIPTSRNQLHLRKEKDSKRQRRSPPTLPARTMPARGKSGTQWSNYYCGNKSN